MSVIYAISDLHLSRTGPDGGQHKPMTVFGPAWADHQQRLDEQWRQTVAPEDTVLLSGDLSWAMTLEEAVWDLGYLGELPGKKIIIKGNHDYWWQSLTKLKTALHPSIIPLQHTVETVGGWAVTGTRGWLLPGHSDFKEADDGKIYQRELLRLEMGLEQAATTALPIMVMLHFPPLSETGEDSGFSELLEKYSVKYCLYGHIHGEKANTFSGEKNGIVYYNCSSDRLEMRPIRVTEAG